MEHLSKTYDSAHTELRWYPLWEQAKIFEAPSSSTKSPYTVLMPPPNVTGVLHNGHALFVTLQDVLVRYHRMKGFNALWLPGIDHAGIATQAVVEREIARTKNTTRQQLGREQFLGEVWAWKDKNGSRIIEQMKLLGASADWSKTRFTMDDQCSRAVKEAFVRLWNEGLIYRGERLVNWDPLTQTALSDEEVEHVTRPSELWAFAYLLKNDPSTEIVIATTRPETMLGDVAVAVNPTDSRFTHLIGKELIHPFFPDRQIKVIADDFVDPEFGTGAVKITPAHDPNDFAMGERHALAMINVFTWDGKINANGGPYSELDAAEARKKIKEDLTEMGLFRHTQPIEHAVGVSQRSGAVIEPMLSRQYFVRCEGMARLAYEAVENGQTRILPENWKKTWDHFLLNIRDWCISRQLWWGHQIPVFYDLTKLPSVIEAYAKRKNVETSSLRALRSGVSASELLRISLFELDDDLIQQISHASTDDHQEDVRAGRLIQEEDVLDTWFSAGLWPMATLGWPEATNDLKVFYPSAVLETGFDILFFWVARMMMFGCHFMAKPPFADIYLHAMVRDAQGRKMSKSLGNAIDPIDVVNGITLDALLEKTKTYPVPPQLLPKVLEGIRKDYPQGIPASGADGLRLSLAILSGQGRDVKLAIPRVAGYRAFLNKVWNAARFALMNVEGEEISDVDSVKAQLNVVDRWMMSRLQKTISRVEYSLANYRFDEAADTIYQFFWSEFCDWYIELAKSSLQDEQKKSSTCAVIVELLDVSMRLFHPFCPFISEEIWQSLPGKDKRWAAQGVEFCAVAPYPHQNPAWVDDDAEKQVSMLQEVVVMIRNARQESNLPAQKKVAVSLLVDSKDHIAFFEAHAAKISKIAYVENLTIGLRSAGELPKNAAINSCAYADVVLPLEGLIDTGAELLRLEKELAKIEKDLLMVLSKLEDDNFVARAPQQVVTQFKQQAAELEQKKTRVQMALSRMKE